MKFIASRQKKQIPFDFVLETLESLAPYTKPMFGCTAVYIEDKIVFVLRNRKDHIEDNGVWVATTPDFHKSLKLDLPSLRSLKMFGPKSTGWQVLPSQFPDFESSVMKACELVLESDPRIGKIPKTRIRRASPKTPTKLRSKK